MKRIRVITTAGQKNPSARQFRWGAAALTALAVIAAGCGTSSGGGGGRVVKLAVGLSGREP